MNIYVYSCTLFIVTVVLVLGYQETLHYAIKCSYIVHIQIFTTGILLNCIVDWAGIAAALPNA